jgi:hypothetical protein
VHQAWPLSLREQGPLASAQLDAVTFTAHGELPRPPAEDTLVTMSRLRLARFGKAAMATALALDAAPRLEGSPSCYLVLGHQVLPRWSVALLALGLLLPALITAIDGFARARRRAGPAGPWLRWALGVSVPFVVVVAAAELFGLLDWLPGNAAEAIAPATAPSFAEAAPALAALALLFALAWLVLKPLVGGGARPHGPEVAVSLAQLLSVEVLVLWFGNPFAALLLVPVVHLCLLTALPEGPNRRVLLGAVVVAALFLPVLVLAYYGARFDLGADVSRYLLLVLSGQESLGATTLGALIAGSLLAVVKVVLGRPEPERATEVTIRGPSTYAGPGSLGGTESALRRS